MKNLKKCVAFLLAAVVLVSALGSAADTSAATLTAKQYLTKMEKAVKAAKSFEITQTSTKESGINGDLSETKQTTKKILFTDPLKSKTVSTTKSPSGSQKTVVYVQETSEGNIYEWRSTDGSEYEKKELPESYSPLGSIDLELAANSKLFSDAKIVKKSVKVNKVSTVQISATVKGSALKDTLDTLGLNEKTLESLNQALSYCKPLKVTIWLDKKTYCPVKMAIDAKDFYNSMMQTLMNCTPYGKVKITSTFSNFNKATKFSLPAACK